MGSIEGARKAREKVMKRDPDFYTKKLPSMGGSVKRPETRTFYKNRVLARLAGRKGGLNSNSTPLDEYKLNYEELKKKNV